MRVQMATHLFKDLLMATDPTRIGPGEFFFKELGTRTTQQVIMTLGVAHLNEMPVFNSQRALYETYGLWDVLLTLLDICAGVDDSLVQAINAQAINAQAINKGVFLDIAQLCSFKLELTRRLRTPVAITLAEKPGMHPFVPMESHYRLYDVVDTLLTNDCTQVSITTDKNVLLNVITLESVVRFIYINRLRLHPWYFSTTLGDLGLAGPDKLCTINENEHVIEAFKLMSQKKLSCVAVINSERRLVGCINLCDLHVVFKPKRSIADLFLPATQFIEIGKLLSRGVIPPPFAASASCSKSSTLGELVNYAIRNRTWNFVYTEPNGTVSGLVTSRDIVNAFYAMDSRLGVAPSFPKRT